MSYADFETRVARINDILCAVNLLTWDSRVMMPPGGVEARGRQISTLMSLARELATSDELQKAIESSRLELADEDDIRRRAVEAAASGIACLSRIPSHLVAEAAELKTKGQHAWAKARAENNFAAFAPLLERSMDIQRAIAGHIGYDEHPYDALCNRYEPGMTWSRLKGLYGELKAGIRPLLDAALHAKPARVDILARNYPIEKQKAFSRTIAARMGYDFERGRLDETVHPFEMSFTRADVRITGRFSEDWLPRGLFAVWHESGHGIYEQNIAAAFTRSAFTTDFVNLYAVGGASFGTHESQSRLWENRVGRSRRFWDQNFSALKAEFKDQLADVSVNDFWRAVNAAQPGLVRSGADELTYDMHIILRSEIEAGLMEGSIKVRDLPAIWGEKMQSSLGLTVTSDTQGVLQDIHWSSGMVGSFPTYTIGNIMSSQFFRSAQAVPAVERGLDTGDYAPLKDWLSDKVHRHGRSLTPTEILEQATGKALSTEDYIFDLTRKVEELTA